MSLAAAALTCPIAALGETASVPDSVRIATLRLVLPLFDDVRVGTGGEKLLTHGPVVSSDGLRLSGVDRGWGISSEAGSQGRLLPWAEIESIHARKGSGSGIAVGAIAGLAIGLTISTAEALSHAHLFSNPEYSGTPILVGLLAGAALGALIDRPGPWRSVYP